MTKANFRLYSNCGKGIYRYVLVIWALLSGGNGFSQVKPNPKPAVAKSLLQNSFVMCEVLPGAEVASKSPFTIPFKNAVAWPTENIQTGCRYIFKSEDDEAEVSIALTDLGSAANAGASYKNAFEASRDLWGETPVTVIAVQDTGFFSGKDECGLKFHLGKYILDINFKGQFPEVSDIMKKRLVLTWLKWSLKECLIYGNVVDILKTVHSAGET